MNKYERALSELESKGTTKFKVFGQSMRPLIKSGSVLTFLKSSDYQIGDVVFCKVQGGRYIDAHLITKMDAEGRYLISNNHGHDNGWARTVFGRVIEVNGDDFGRAVLKEG